jgi:hydrogenase nickel incorporation protein HypB
MFQESSALILNKIDLLPYTNASIEKIKKNSLSLNKKLKIFEVSCRTGEGIGKWVEWLRSLIK